MLTKNRGIIYFVKNIKDNDLYIKILSSNDNVNSGMVYGGNSSKKKLIYQNGYFIDYFIKKKNESSPPIISGEISKPYLGTLLNDKYKLNAFLSMLSIINLSIVEGQSLKGFFEDTEQLSKYIIKEKHWIVFYCEWLFSLLRHIGYEIDYKSNKNKHFYNISLNTFENYNKKNSIIFPHNLFSDKKNINFLNLKAVFEIFESIFIKNHLENSKYKMPDNFINFKKIILLRLQT